MRKPSFGSRLSLLCSVALTLFLAPDVAFAQSDQTLFTQLKPKDTGVRFTNTVRENDSLHVLNYEYLYNGHGIGIGDFNNDGYEDIFISGNTVPHKLFLNKGKLQFEDVTRKAGVSGNGTWGTGVSIADVNGDGLLDIYVCHSGRFSGDELVNELFINVGTKKGVPRFREAAREYGLAAPGTQSTQAAFFDYDRDGDLDMFLLNHSIHSFYPFLNTSKQRATPDMRYGNRLFRNDGLREGGPVFTDVTLEAGIINNALNYGLSVNVSDVNDDGWPDIYTTSDYSEHDCLYVNNGDGTFSQTLQQSFAYISKYSMGADIADINNDGLLDIYTLDMLPEDNRRQKLLKGPDQYDQYHLLVDSGYYRQHMRNMLQLNRGVHNGNVIFSEIGQLSGVSNTDWSWAALFADFNGDGWKDLLVTNGYLRDFTDMDFLKYTMPDAQLKAAMEGRSDFKTYDLVRQMPSNKLRNYLFRNNGDLTFSDVSVSWGLDALGISNAAVYADLDNDGDYELVIGNNNEPVMLYRNNLNPAKGWLKLVLEGESANRFGVGARIWVYGPWGVQLHENHPVRGFQSSVGSPLLFYIPSDEVDSVVVRWPTGKQTVVADVQTGRTLRIVEEVSPEPPVYVTQGSSQRLFKGADVALDPAFRHVENSFVDFQAEVLLPYQLSRMGPALARADVNGDGLDDVFIGGALGQTGALYLQQSDGSFVLSASRPWQSHRASEDVNAIFFDADGDGDADLYVVSGGNEYEEGAVEYQDRLYLNNGSGVFNFANGALPVMRSNKQAVAVGDFDFDGDLDLFIGGRGKPGYFPLSSPSYLLRNDGHGLFTDVTDSVAPALREPGMVTVAQWADLDGDEWVDLVIAGDWSPVRVFRNESGRLSLVEAESLKNTHGQWSALELVDVDGDGDADLVLGNAGLNHQYRPSVSEPATLHVSDFDNNGAIDPIFCYYIQGSSYPVASRDQLLDQIPALKKKFLRYSDYADAMLGDIFSEAQIAEAELLTCNEMRSLVFLNNGAFDFMSVALPTEAQFSRTSAILPDDYDGDGHLDLVLLGNFYPYRTELGESAASVGIFLKGNGDGMFEAVTPAASGLFATGDVRTAVTLNSANGIRRILVGKNDDLVQLIEVTRGE